MNRAQLLAKLDRVIHSCETLDQLRVAKAYSERAFKVLNESYWQDKGFSCMGDSLSLFESINKEIRDKKRQILNLSSLPRIPQPIRLEM